MGLSYLDVEVPVVSEQQFREKNLFKKEKIGRDEFFTLLIKVKPPLICTPLSPLHPKLLLSLNSFKITFCEVDTCTHYQNTVNVFL